MKFSPVRLAFAALASLAMASSADAETILIFGQQQNTNAVTATSTGGTTTLSSTGTPVTVTNVGGITPPSGTVFLESFSFTSNAAITGSNGNLTQGGFSGTFAFVSGSGAPQVVGTLTNGVLSTFTGPNGTTGSFNSSNVTFTALGAAILAQLGIPGINPNVQGTISLSLNNFLPTSVTSLNFTARNSGLVTANVVPEPASVVMMGMALVAGLGGLGLRRVRAARA